MEPSEFKISFSVKSYDEKTAKNYWNCYVDEKYIVHNYQRYRFQILIAQIEDLNEDCVKISLLYIIYFPRKKT